MTKEEYKKITDQIVIFCKNAKEKTFNWPREIKIFKKIFRIYPEIEFWQNLDLGFKLNSMAWFLTTDGKNFLCQKFNENRLTNLPKQSIIFDNENLVVENLVVEQKPKTAMEFLKN